MSNVILISVPEEKLEQLIETAVRNAITSNTPSKQDSLKEFLTRREASEYLGVSIATIDNWTRQRKITKHYNGSSVRFKKSELDSSFDTLSKYHRG